MGGRGGGSSRAASNEGPAAPAAAATTIATTALESRILSEYRRLQVRFDNEWVILSELRSRLGGTSREEQDRALMSLVSERRIRLIPEENQKTLTSRDIAAAINVGGEMKHLIGIPS